MAGLGSLFTTRKIVEAARHSRSLGEFNTTFLASDQGGYSDGYRGFMSLPAAWRASTLIADLIGQLPWHAYRDKNGEPALLLEPTPIMLLDPSPPRTRMEVFSSMALDLLWHGNGIAVITSRNAAGIPTSMLPIPACQVQITYLDGSTIYGHNGELLEPVIYRIGTWVGTAADVIHVKGPCQPGALRGLGVLETQVRTLSTSVEQERQASSIARHGVPTGVLQATDDNITEQELIDTKTGWLESQRAATIAALAPGIEFRPIAWTPKELQMVDARKFTTQQIALMFGLPGRYLGVEGGSLTYSTPVLDSVDLLRFTLAAHLARFEQELSRHYPRGTWVKANVDALTRADLTTRYAAHEVAIRAGFLTIDEVRAIEDLPPLPEPAVIPEDSSDDVVAQEIDAVAQSDLEQTQPADQGRSAEPIVVNLTLPEQPRPQIRIVRVDSEGVKGADDGND